jgi:hypothetical protein
MSEIETDLQSYCNQLFRSFEDAFAGNEIKDLEKGITSFYLYKATRLLKAIINLGKNDFGPEGYILLRTLLNLCINLKWMFEKSVPYRTRRYADFDVVFKQKGIEALLRSGTRNEKETLIAKAKQNSAKINALKRKYGIPDDYDMNSWSGKPINDMAKETEMSWYYDLVYSFLSNHEHTNPNSVHEYFEEIKDGKMRIKDLKSDEKSQVMIIRALHIYLEIVAVYNTQFETKVERNELEFLKLEKEILSDDG